MKSIFTNGQSLHCSNNHLHSPLQRVHTFFKYFAFTLGFVFLAAVSPGQGVGSTVVGFEVDGSFRALTIPPYWRTSNPNQNYFGGTGVDWSKKIDGSGTAILTQSGDNSIPGITADRTAIWQIDGNWGTNTPPDMSVFDGDNKNDYLIGAGDIRYTIKTGSSGPQKNDITNVFLHTRRDANDDLWLFFAAETRSTSGASYLDFEYNQAGVVADPLGQVGTRRITGLGPNGGRTIDDILMVINYTQGGRTPVVGVRKWLGTAWSDELPLAAGTNFMTTNTLDVASVAPLASYAGDGTPSSTSIAFQVVEGAVNISSLELEGLEECSPNATVTVKTRSSPSFTSTLKDWDILNFPLTPTSSSSVADIAPQCRNLNGTNIFSVTGTYADGAPEWTATGGTLSNESYVNGVATATLTVEAPTTSATVTLTTASLNPSCSSAVASKTATVYARPVVSADVDPDGPLSMLTSPPQYRLHTTVDGALDPASGYTFAWAQDPNTGGLSSTTIPNPGFSAPAAGEYDWTVTVTNSNGCTSTATVSAELIPQAPCPAVLTPAMCAGTSYEFSADVPPAAGETWTWSVADADADATNNPSITSLNGLQSVTVLAGTQNFTLTLTKTYANPVLSPQVCPYDVTVIPAPTCSITGADAVCSGSTGNTYTSAVSPAEGTVTHSWTISGNGTIAGATNGASISVTAGASGSYTVTDVITRNGCTSTCTKTVTVNPIPTCSITGADAVCSGSTGNTYTSAVSPAEGTVTHSWTISGNGTIAGATNGASISVTAGASGSYTVTDVITRNGCTSTCSKTVIVQDCGCPGPVALCTPPSSFDRDVIVNSNLNWADVLSGISPDNIRGSIRISGNGKLTVPNQDVLLKSNRAVLVIEGIEFVVKNGNFVLDNRGAQVIIKNAIVRISGNLQQKPLTKLCISGTELEVGDEGSNGLFNAGNSTTSGDFQNDGGYRYLKDVCLNVTHDLQLSSTGDGTAIGGGLDIFIGVYGEIGDRGANDACTGIVDGDDSGNFQNNKRQEIYCSEFEVIENIQIQSSSAMLVRDVDFRTLNGSFQNSGSLSGSGLSLAIDDLIQNSGSWTATVDMWYAQGTSGNLNIGTKAASLQAVLDAKFSCGCSEDVPNTFVLTTRKVSTSDEVSSLELNAWPNPSNSGFMIRIGSGHQRERMSLKITDHFGRLVQIFDRPLNGQLLKIGENYRPGIYVLELVQGKNRRQQKLIRLP